MKELQQIVDDVTRTNHDHTAVNIKVFAKYLKKAIDGDKQAFVDFLESLYIKNMYITVKLYEPADYKDVLNNEIKDAILTLPSYLDKTAFCGTTSRGLSATITRDAKKSAVYREDKISATVKGVLSGIDPTRKFKEFIAANAELILSYLDEDKAEEPKEVEDGIKNQPFESSGIEF